MDQPHAEADADVVDVIVLTRDGLPPPGRVRSALREQRGVRIRLHVVDGTAWPGETNRLATIARARNAGSQLGSAPWVMFLDDDVILGPSCIAMLLQGLRCRAGYAALAADYLGELPDLGPFEISGHSDGLLGTPHVAMGATMFRRDALAQFAFRWRQGRCECQCCCDDLRRAGLGIAYLPGARATHDPGQGGRDRNGLRHPSPGPRVLTAFDRRHLGRFLHQFLPTLRESGNDTAVTAVAYGLWPRERRKLVAAPGVEAVFLDGAGDSPSIRRLRDFQDVIARWPDETPVAHWDAGDVIFQAPLEPLWRLVGDRPERLLAVREPSAHPENTAVAEWTLSIHDPPAREYAFGLLSRRPVLNGGFAAGTARAMLGYLREADRLLHSRALRGTSDWGDQTVLNLYCHSRPERWEEIPDTWNFTIYQRDGRDYRIGGDGRFETARGEPIAVVHGNAGTLDWRLFAGLISSNDRTETRPAVMARRIPV